MPAWPATSSKAPAGERLRTLQSMLPARLKVMLPAFKVRWREILRRSTGSTSAELDAPPLSLRFIVSSIGGNVHWTLRSAAARIEQWWNYSRPGLSDCETDRRNTNDTVSNW